MPRVRAARSARSLAVALVGAVAVAIGIGCGAHGRHRVASASPVASRPRPPSGEAILVAVTVDDLPRHGPDTTPPTPRRAVVDAFLHAFARRHVPRVYGFVNGRDLDEHPEDRDALVDWVRAGHPLANHTFSHADANKIGAAAFVADVDADERLLRSLVPEGETASEKVFRYPYLREGADAAARSTIRAQLAARGYRVAPVTIDFFDWAFNPAFVRCRAAGDDRAVAALRRAYLDAARAQLAWADRAARHHFGRPIPHVLLLHAGVFDALVIDDLLDALAAAGARFVTLDEALADPAYATEPDEPRAQGTNLLHFVARSRGDERSVPPPAEPDAWLDGQCR